MPPNNRQRQPGGAGEAYLLLGFMVTVLASVGVFWMAMHLGHRFAGTGVDVPGNPFELVFSTIGGDLDWPGTWGYLVLAGLAVLFGLPLLLIVLAVRGRRRSRADGASSFMGRGRDIAPLTAGNAASSSKRLGVQGGSAGVPIGTTVRGGKPLVATWEDMHIDIWGPRTGKTTSRAIPAILEAPGAVLVTSNKRDVVDATRGPRSAEGADVWVFDPQEITGESATWWWNPLSYVTDEVKAAKLAEHFAAASTGERRDAHFESNGEDLLAALLLAAAVDGRPITQVYRWLTHPGDTAPAEILADGGYPMTSDQLAGIQSTPERERGSIYSTARRMASCLTYRHITAWVTRDGGHAHRPEFDPDDFVASHGTLYSLSKEGKGSAGPLVMALTAAVIEAGEERAVDSPGGRLPTPLLGVLDEAANVCRWRQLPNLYSHYGSRGIVLMTILQSWSQGVDVWGESGMKKLWSAANVKVYGGGVAETSFLEDVSRLIGDYERTTSTSSSGRGGRSVSRQVQRERILDVADLGSLPRGRAVVIASGARPTMIRTTPWTNGRHAKAVKASISSHDPNAERTIREAQTVIAPTDATGAP